MKKIRPEGISVIHDIGRVTLKQVVFEDGGVNYLLIKDDIKIWLSEDEYNLLKGTFKNEK